MNDKAIHRRLASLPGVQAAVTSAAEGLQRDAQAVFQAHDRPGGHELGIDKRGLDRFVYLEGPAPLSVEFGHFTRTPKNPTDAWMPTWVQGLRMFDKAVNRARTGR